MRLKNQAATQNSRQNFLPQNTNSFILNNQNIIQNICSPDSSYIFNHNNNNNPNRSSMNEDSRNDILNGSSNTSTSSASAVGNNDDLDLDSGDADRKRAHHNALERKRRDHIKDSFHTLRDAIPNIRGEKTSRAQILKAATDYIKLMRTRNIDFQCDIDSLRKQNLEIENQIRQLEKAKLGGGGPTDKQIKSELLNYFENNLDTQDYKDIKFDLVNETSTTTQTAPTTTTTKPPSTTNTTNLSQTFTSSTTKNPNTTNVLVLNKPLITTTTLSANPKKFKTIINTKNNINIINLNHQHHHTNINTPNSTTVLNTTTTHNNNNTNTNNNQNSADYL